jgi:hypothetical protein
MPDHNWFECFISHDHNAVPRHADHKRGWETPVKTDESFIYEHILKNLQIAFLMEQLTPLFDRVERSHNEVVRNCGKSAPHQKKIRSVLLLPSDHVRFQEFMSSVESCMGRPTAQRNQHPSFPKVQYFGRQIRHHFLIVYQFRYLCVAVLRISLVLRMSFYIVKG